MPLSQRYEEIQTLPADRSDQTFANRICLGRLRRRPQHASSAREQDSFVRLRSSGSSDSFQHAGESISLETGTISAALEKN